MERPVMSAEAQEALHSKFLTILPRIELHARIYFCYVRCPSQRTTASPRSLPSRGKGSCGLTERGQDATQFLSALAMLTAKAMMSGRRFMELGLGC